MCKGVQGSVLGHYCSMPGQTKLLYATKGEDHRQKAISCLAGHTGNILYDRAQIVEQWVHFLVKRNALDLSEPK